jgi:glycerol-3-phosphate acyltransferase PlsY
LTTVLAAVAGYVIGSLPTAIWLGRMWGVDLRAGGTGNPGANNARRLGGNGLAILVLVVEVAKGFVAVVVGSALGGDVAAVVAGVGAVVGNMYNVWLGFDGGKGLSIAGGVLLGIWPVVFPFAIVLLVTASALTRSSGRGAIISLLVLVLAAALWERFRVPPGWGVEDPGLLFLGVAGITLVLFPKHWHDARHPVRSPARP